MKGNKNQDAKYDRETIRTRHSHFGSELKNRCNRKPCRF